MSHSLEIIFEEATLKYNMAEPTCAVYLEGVENGQEN